MDIKRVLKTLHSLERKIIPYLESNKNVNGLVKVSGMEEVEVIRALQWLENKEVLKIKSIEKKIIILNDKAKNYKELPERRVINNLEKSEISLDEIKNKAKLTDIEINAIIGLLKKKEIIEIKKGNILKIKLSSSGEKLKNEKTSEEKLFLKIINNIKNPIIFDQLNNEEKSAFENLRSRGLITSEIERERIFELTEDGKKLIKEKIDTNIIESLTPEIIKDKEWKNKEFRAYDIKINVPSIYGGKRHFVDKSIDYMKHIWLDMGFVEMTGNVAETAFWNLDSLFVPQDHPAREMQDTFYIGKKGSILKGNIPEELSNKIKKVHENGWFTGSKGWGGTWDKEIAKQVMLRTHTTCLSARTLSKLKKEDLPAKFFAIGKVYRNEALDWKHLFEFYQVEGIVVDPNANFRHLLGYLREFYRKMGYSDIKIKPSYFPYVEPGCEVFVWHPAKKEWIEVGGAGILRPEVTKPLLGFECPVLAWGQGMERIITSYYKINDLREIYKNDLKLLREAKEFLM